MLRFLVGVMLFAGFLVLSFPSALAEGIVDPGARRTDVPGFVRMRVRRSLGRRRLRQANAIARAILDGSARYGFDPLLVMAVVRNESGFSARKRGRHGEIGLMQLKPATARWIARRARLRWGGKRSLENPEVNVRLGTAYMAMLRGKYRSSRSLYLAAYNMGSARLNRCLRRNIVPAAYSGRVMRFREQYLSELGQDGRENFVKSGDGFVSLRSAGRSRA